MRFGGALLISLALFFGFSPARADDCIGEQDAWSIEHSFSWLDADQKPLTFDRCDSKSLVFKIYRAIADLRDLPQLDDRRDEFNRGMLGEDPYTYFLSKVRGFIFDQDKSEDCDVNTAAFYDDDPNGFIHICPVMKSASSMQTMLVLVHEARHSQGFEHETCTTLLRRKPRSYSCDRSYETGGAYAVAAELAIRISRTPLISPDRRSDARLTALSDLTHRFNKLPFGMRRGIALQTEGDSILFFDGKKEIETMFDHALPRPFLTQRFGMPVLYSATGARTHQYVFAKNLIETRGEYAKDFREKFTNEQRENLIDVYYGPATVSFQLYNDHLVCSKLGSPDQSMKIESFRPRRVVSLSEPGTEQMFAILSEDGRLFQLPRDLKVEGVSDRKLKPLKVAEPYLDLVALGFNRYYAINKKAELVRLVRLSSAPVKVHALDGIHLKRITGPLAWSRKLEDL